jgi:hypothetical protein
MRIPQLHLVRNSPRHSAERGPPATEIARQVGTCNCKKWLANSKSGLVTALLDHDSPAVQGVDEGIHWSVQVVMCLGGSFGPVGSI